MMFDITYQNGQNPGFQNASNRQNMQAAQSPSSGLQMGPEIPMEDVLDPQSNEEVVRGSLQQDLANNLGYYVEIDFLIGSSNIVTQRGILYSVGVNYVTLYHETEDRYVVCDLYSIKFVTFYNSRVTPRSQQSMGSAMTRRM